MAAFSPIWWSQAATNEVYGLNLYFVSLIFLLLIQLLKGNSPRRSFLLLAYVLGLAFTNHLQTVLLFPTLFLLYYFHRKTWKLDIRTGVLAGFLFFLGLSPYLFLPIRSATGPLADWGGTSDLGNFIRHVSGWQYRVYMFSIPFEKVYENGQDALRTVASQPRWPFWLLLPGLFLIRRPGWKTLAAFALYPAAAVAYNANYDIFDIDVYYLPVIFVFFLLVGAGAFGWFAYLSRLKKGKGLAGAGILVLLLFSTAYAAVSNWGRSDQSKNRFAQEALDNIYKSAPAGGLVFVSEWDHYSPWLYNHFVLKRRPDLRMLDVNLTNRSWYLDFLQRALPETVAGLEEKISSYRVLVRDFEEGRPFDTAKIEALHQSILASILRKSLEAGPVYFDVATGFDSAAGWFLAPEGAVFRVYDRPGYYPYKTPPLGFSRGDFFLLPEKEIIRREVETLSWILNLRKNYETIFGPKSDGAGRAVPP